jgi:hypothetical protein
VLDNTVLRRIFGPKTGEETRKRRALLNEEFYNFVYVSPNIIQMIKKDKIVRAFGTYMVINILSGHLEGKPDVDRTGILEQF